MNSLEDKLPVEILSQIAMGRQDMRVMRLVSSRWKAAFDASVTALSLPLKECAPSVEDLLRRFPKLVKLRLTGLDLLDSHIASLGLPPERPSLAIHLDLPHRGYVYDAGLAHLIGWPITQLDMLNSARWTDAGVRHLAALPLLTDLRIGAGPLTDSGLALLAPLPLTRLRISDCQKLTEAVLGCLAAMPLSHLELEGCRVFQEPGLAHLSALPLVELRLGGYYNLTNAGLASLTRLALTRLSLSGADVTDAGLTHLRELPLVRLSLGVCDNIRGAGLVHLTGMSSLVDLDLSCCDQLRDEGLSHLRQLPSLTRLSFLDNKRLTDAALVHVGELSSLAALKLSGCLELTEEGLLFLNGLSSLTELDISGFCLLTGVGLAYLAALPLASLNVKDSGGWKSAGVRVLGRLSQLSSLTLSANMMTGGQVATLTRLKKLVLSSDSRRLSERYWTDEHLAQLASGAGGLTELSLKEMYGKGGQGFTDAGLAHVARITSLTSLDLSSNYHSLMRGWRMWQS